MAAPFQNLDFESAVIGTPVNYQLPASQALPYWTIETYHPGYVLYDTVAVGSTAISVQDGLSPYQPGGSPFMYPLEGNFSIMLQDGSIPDGIGGLRPQDPWISQTGDIPANASSIMFSTDLLSLANVVVSLNGTPIPTSLYSVAPVINANYGPVETYIGDVSAFSGQQNVVLRF